MTQPVHAAGLTALLGSWRTKDPANVQLAATLRALLLDGRIPLQTRLPPERALAAALGLSRATVTAAYDRLRDEGYLASRQGSGSWTTLPARHGEATDSSLPGGAIDMAVAALPAPADLDSYVRDAMRELPGWLDHHGYDPLGLPPLRRAIAAMYTARGLHTSAEQILVTNGSMHAIDLAVRTLVRRGDTAIAEVPCYPTALDALRAAGARLDYIPVSPEGWDVELVRQVLARRSPPVAYVNPEFHNPTGMVMDESSRRRLVRMLERAGTRLIVDETFAPLRLTGAPLPPPVACWSQGEAVTVGSLSKAVWGGLRVGWARAEPAFVHRLAATRASVDMASPVIEQLVAVRLLADLESIVNERRALAAGRLAALAGALRSKLPAWRYLPPAGGLFVWAELPVPMSTVLCVRAMGKGVRLTPGWRFAAPGLLERFLRLPFSLPPDRLEQAVEVLARAAASGAGPARRSDAPEYVA